MPTALEIAEEVKQGKRSALETTQDYLSQIKQKNEELGVFLNITEDFALSQAKRIDEDQKAGKTLGVLAGVPVALKDNLCMQGVETTCSSKILEGWKSPYDATVIKKLKASDAILIGKTNLDEFAMGSSTENSAYFPTRNPVNPEFVPGGSSGGSAAAVAANFAPLALGSDTGGSIRQPASLCGVVGLKPTYGLVSRYGLIAFASSLDQIGPFAQNVADAALLLEVISGHDPDDSTSIPTDARTQSKKNVSSYLEGLQNLDISDLKVGLVKELMGEGIDKEVLSRVNEAADALANEGCKVEEVSIPGVSYGLSAYYLIAPAEASSNLSRYDGVRYGLRVEAENVEKMNIETRTQGFGEEVKRRIMLGTFALSSGYYDDYYIKAQRVRTLIVREFEKAYEKFDILLSPTSPSTAFKFGEKTDDPLKMYLCDICTIPSSLTGSPAMSVPYKTGKDDMPVGVQVLAPTLGEVNMLRVASCIEKAANSQQ